jgi:DNA gyrase subunit A
MTQDNTVSVSVVDEMKEAYGAYAMAVIIGRAIPDLYDGFKPAQRRILTAMKWLNLRPDAKFMKCARVVGETMGKLHPQGGCYGTLVGMTQWWTNNSILINGHGNFGSPTDGAAAERYTECKLTEFTQEALLCDADVWQTRPSYDGSFQEPIQLNVKVPQLLLNGAEGIAVGFATRIPTHNLRGVVKALHALVEGNTKEAAKHLIPDFPTGCEVVKDEGLLAYMQTGSGSFRMRAVVAEEEVDWGKRSKRVALVFNNLPLHINTEQLGDQVKASVEKGQITTVADVRDETDMNGVRFVVVLKANASVEQAKAELYRYTSLDTRFSANNTVIDGTKPVQLAPYDILSKWFAWRDETIVRIFSSELGQRRSRLEVIQGLMSALDMIDDVIDAIRRSKDKGEARTKLIARDFTEIQANAILDMRLSQLTKLDDKVLRTEGKEVQARIKELIKLNSNKKLRQAYILDEVDAVATRHGNARRSKVIAPPAEMSVQVIKQGRTNIKVEGPKPRFVQVDEGKGILTQQKKLDRKSWVVPSDDKMLFVCDNGFFVKVGARHKGPLFDAPTKVLFKAKTSSLPDTPLVVVYKIGDAVYGNVLTWESLTKCTARGKSYLPEGAELIHLGGTYTLPMAGRRKDKVIGINTVKSRPVGGKGTKLANLSDTNYD